MVVEPLPKAISFRQGRLPSSASVAACGLDVKRTRVGRCGISLQPCRGRYRITAHLSSAERIFSSWRTDSQTPPHMIVSAGATWECPRPTRDAEIHEGSSNFVTVMMVPHGTPTEESRNRPPSVGFGIGAGVPQSGPLECVRGNKDWCGWTNTFAAVRVGGDRGSLLSRRDGLSSNEGMKPGRRHSQGSHILDDGLVPARHWLARGIYETVASLDARETGRCGSSLMLTRLVRSSAAVSRYPMPSPLFWPRRWEILSFLVWFEVATM